MICFRMLSYVFNHIAAAFVSFEVRKYKIKWAWSKFEPHYESVCPNA